MQMKKLKKCMLLLLCVALIAALALTMTGCNKSEAPASAAVSAEGGVMGQGATVFDFTVTDGDGKETAFEIHTDKTTVGDALLELGLIEGEDSEYGLYVKTVNGITADYDTDGTYWAFYVNGEYAMSGVDTTDIEAGTAYAMKVEK